MTVLVDTNVLLDIFLPDPVWGKKSSDALRNALREGDVVINEIIYAELVPQFPKRDLLDNTLAALGIQTVFMDMDTAYKAGKAWQEYKKAGGIRSRILSDFLIGAHAQVHAWQLLTRDRGFYKKYFKEVKVKYPAVNE